MAVGSHENSLLEFLTDHHSESEDIAPDTDPPGICVVASGILRRNLRERLTSDGIPPNNLARFETIEDLAHRLLRAHHGVRSTVLESRFTLRLLEQVFQQAANGDHSDDLRSFANSIPWTEESVLEQLHEELNEYFRATDAGADHEKLLTVVRDHADPFASETGLTRVELFDEIHVELKDLTERFGESVYLSRNHLVREARKQVGACWEECFGDVDWLAFGTVSVLDNPTLRFLLQIAEDADLDLHLFFERGTRDYFETRLRNLSVEVERMGEPADPKSSGAAALSASIRGEPVDEAAAETVRYVEAPDRRREVEYIVADLRRQFADGVEPSEVLVVARDAGTYLPAVEDVFETNGMPYHVETRRPLAHAAAYRFLKATLDLLAAIEQDQPITHWEIVDPLRLGWCPPNMRSEYWPVSDLAFLYLEESLHNLALRTSDQEPEEEPTLSFEEWQAAIDDLSGWDYPLGLLETFVEWLEAAGGNPPGDGDALRREIQNLELSHIYHTIPRHRESPHGPAVDTGRTNLTRDHSTMLAQRVLGQAGSIGDYFDRGLAVLGTDPTWAEAAIAAGQVAGTSSYGRTNDDARSVRFVDAGNAYFLKADHVYYLGMTADGFPTDFSTPAFLPNQLREAVHRAGVEGDAPFLYLESRNDQYEQEVDLFEASLRSCTGQPTIVRPFKDAEGRDVEWSPFVERYADEGDVDNVETISTRAWLPDRHGEEDWHDLWDRLSMKDRLRSVVYYSRQPTSAFDEELSEDEVLDLGRLTDAEAYLEGLDPRLQRYLRSPLAIRVSPDEPAFDGDLALDDVVGGPIRPHELDLFAQCELKYYFYQLLFAFEGETVQRDAIPLYSSSRPHYRFGELPAVVRHNYTSFLHDKKYETILEDLLPDRQADLDEFATLDELREWFDGRDDFSEWDTRTLLRNLEAEWRLVQQEREAGIVREWSWVGPSTIGYDGHDLRMPAHREDVFPDDEDYRIPVFAIRNSHYASEAMKNCWSAPNQLTDQGYRNEDCTTICQSCSDFGDCTRSTKHTLDHRLHFSGVGIDSLSGVVFNERFASSSDGRRGFVKQNHLDAVRGDMTGGPEADLATWHNRLWWAKKGAWEDDLADHLERLGSAGELSVSVDREFVRSGGCENCVYRELCHVPLQEARR